MAAHEALVHAADLARRGLISPVAHDRLRAWYERRCEEAQADAESLAAHTRHPEQVLEGLKMLVDVERDTLREAVHHGVLAPEVVYALTAETHTRMEVLANAGHLGDEALANAVQELLDGDPEASS